MAPAPGFLSTMKTIPSSNHLTRPIRLIIEDILPQFP